VLGHQLQQNVVVALEGGEHVGVGTQLDQPVLGQVARSATGLPGLLDRRAGVPGAGRLESGRPSLQVPLRLRVAHRSGLLVMHVGHQIVLGELQSVGLRDERQQPPLMHQIVHDGHFALLTGGVELPALQRIPHRDVQCYSSCLRSAAADRNATAN
jgi:hypothetical protein